MPQKLNVRLTLLMQLGLTLAAVVLIWLCDLKVDYWGSLDDYWTVLAFIAAMLSTLLGFIPRLFPKTVLYGKFQELNTMFYEVMRELSWIDIIMISILAGFGEELLFRAFLQSYLSSVVQDYVAVLLASLLFGIVHFSSSVHALFALILGVFLGLVYYWTQSLLLVSLWHTFHDLFAFILLVKYPHYIGIKPKT